MDLKVWVDDVQRIVCGVNPSTTCHDVVLALAVATGQTGRFTLIEKFQNNERLLSPSEKPFQILSKWAEYANDVQFIMKKSPPILHSIRNSNSPETSHTDSTRPNKTTIGSSIKSKLNFNNNNSEATKVTKSSANIKKKIESPSQPSQPIDSCANASSTFISQPVTSSGFTNYQHLSQESNDLRSPSYSHQSLHGNIKQHMGQSPSRKLLDACRDDENRDLNGNTQTYIKSTSVPSTVNGNQGDDRCSSSQSDVSRAFIQLKTPQKVLESRGVVKKEGNNHRESNGNGSNVPRNDVHRYVSRIELPIKSPEHSNDTSIRKSVSAREGPRFAKLVEEVNVIDDQAQFPIHHQTSSSLNSRPRNPPSYNEAVQRSSIYSSTSSSSPSPCFQGPERPADFSCQFKLGQEVGASGQSLSPVRPSRKSKVPKVMFSPASPSSSEKRTVSECSPKLISNNRIDPLRFMSTMQRNALIEEEIVESVELHEPQLKESILMKSKMKEMMEAWKENETELEALEIEFKKKRERDSKHKEIILLKEQSSELESKISITKHKIQLLTDQIREEEHKMEINQRKTEVEEKEKRQGVIEELKNDIRVKELEFEDQQKQFKQLEEEITEISQQIESKTIQVDVILSDIKKENLAGLSVEPSIQLQLLSPQLNSDSVVAKLHSEITKGPTFGENYFYHRIGSTRKMLGYPRELETAVATLKNPNGVWV